MSVERISELVVDLSKDPFDPLLNFNLGVAYEEVKQTAAAVSFYLRAAEYGEDLLVYTSLLKISECFDAQGSRPHSVLNALQQAAAFNPKRPEAYFLLARYYEKSRSWQDCYTWASIGLLYADNSGLGLPADVGYKGKYSLEFEKAISAWWIGRKKECVDSLIELNKLEGVSSEYKNAIEWNLSNINASF